MKRRKVKCTSIFQPLRYLNYLPVLLILLFNPNLSEEQNPELVVKKLKINIRRVTFKWTYDLPQSVSTNVIRFGLFDFPSNPNSLISTFAISRGGTITTNPHILSAYKDRITVSADVTNSAEMTIDEVDIQNDDGKIFGIKIEGSNGGNFFKKTQLQIIEDPIIRIPTNANGDKVYEKTEGEFLMLNCSATGRPLPTITWKRKDTGVVVATGQGSKSLTFEKLDKANHSQFICFAENDQITAYTATVIVNYQPVIDKDKSSKKVLTYINNLTPVILICVAEGRPPPQYTWRNQHGKIISSTRTYSLKSPDVTQIGVQYSCQAKNKIGKSEKHVVDIAQITKPKKATLFEVVKIEPRTVSLKWEYNTDTGGGELKAVEISYILRGDTKKKSYPVSKTATILTDLVPNTLYLFDVSVKNEFFTSDPRRVSKRTRQTAPGAPSRVLIVEKSAHTITVSWELPIETNGNITKYEVRYGKMSEYRDKVKINKLGLERSNVLQNLEPFTDYTIQVRAFTRQRFGGGNWSIKVNGRTHEAAPSKPRNVAVTVMNADTVKLNWGRPESVYGPISRVEVMFLYKEKNGGKEDKLIKEVNIQDIQTIQDATSDRSYTFTSLIAHSTYQAKIREGAGDLPLWGNYSNIVEFVTPEGVPLMCRFLQVTHRTSTSLTVSWRKPEHYNGILTYFNVYYENNTKRYEEKLDKDLTNKTFRVQLHNLRDGTKYTLSVQAFTSKGGGGISKKYETSTSAYLIGNEELVDDKISTGPIIGGIFSFLVILVLLILLILYIARKQRIQKKHANKSDAQPFNLTPSPEHQRVPDNEYVSTIRKTPDTINSNGTAPPAPVLNGNAPCRTFASIRSISIDELKEYCDKNHEHKDTGFIQEFKSIKSETDLTWEVSLRVENKCKNRYANIIAYDHSRVILNQIENAPGSDYINANYIDGYKRKGKFIATQGPVAASFNDFWRMVWEQNCHVIVMVTNLIEKSRIKCQKYWPTGDAQQYGSIAVTPEEEIELADYVIRKFAVVMSSSKLKHESRKVTQYQFSSWPDHGVPQYPTGLLQFIKRVRASSAEDNHAGPIICHCSAGVGRSGTYITLDAMLDRIHDESSVDILGFVSHIRGQRNLMVQTEAQYIFTYDALLEAVICGNTEITVSELPMRIKRLENVNEDTGITYMQEEFERLSFNLDESSQYEAALLPINATKNRFPSILPFESTRVKLWPYPGVEGSDYINGSFVDGYQQREAYIVTQSPLENTVEDVWRMLWEYEIFSILMLSSPEERDMHHCYPYWPIDSEPASFGLLLVQIAAEEERSGYVKREFRVTNSKTGETRVVTHFMFYDWPEDTCPSDPAEVLDMVSQLQKTQQMTGNGSMVIHCNDGCGRTGTICALMFSIERVKLEGAIDIFQTVRMMRTQRTGIIRSLDQYRFCYNALKKFIDTFSDYANFK